METIRFSSSSLHPYGSDERRKTHDEQRWSRERKRKKNTLRINKQYFSTQVIFYFSKFSVVGVYIYLCTYIYVDDDYYYYCSNIILIHLYRLPRDGFLEWRWKKGRGGGKAGRYGFSRILLLREDMPKRKVHTYIHLDINNNNNDIHICKIIHKFCVFFLLLLHSLL